MRQIGSVEIPQEAFMEIFDSIIYRMLDCYWQAGKTKIYEIVAHFIGFGFFYSSV